MDPFTPKGMLLAPHPAMARGSGNDMFDRYQVIHLIEHRVRKQAHEGCRESDSMLYIAANTNIPVPKVNDTKLDAEDSFSYIVMEYTENELNNFLAHNAEGTQGPHLLRNDNHIIHFAHGDLSPRNILVDEGGRITAIIDWDILRMRMDFPRKRKMPDHPRYFQSIFPPKYKQNFSALAYLAHFEPLVPGSLPLNPFPTVGRMEIG
ncbi:conserved hypothetical protein [Histoplasma capsulatum G186AR]|uniref:Aminoglycoside phosphotransferase domain-containing protein n=1 Tax=Ajellomyces capsulatus (strain G186AR / H82 / ATCC MYA-2454 / RMSCC 2432) TaxID=447093 RepID=C0NLQ0_AJECG|nr:uncharacterized protein HCBG_04430 [Histoplasma capsulatum G186AR]EEH07551.1 conserved hypothetical protein [Histoplasma capsulatum G186AR]